jgi:plastocyanin
MRNIGMAFCVAALSAFNAASSFAGDVTFQVLDDKGRVLSNAVVSLTPLFEGAGSQGAQAGKLEMKQQGALFKPFVLPVAVGATVSFPNLDEFRHHVYSFSKSKRFELRLYGQDETKSVTFEQSGVIALGCNIHDNMLAYVYVTDSPIFAKTDISGKASFAELETGNYQLTVWHPDQKRSQEGLPAEVAVTDATQQLDLTLQMKKVRRPQQLPSEDEYN